METSAIDQTRVEFGDSAMTVDGLKRTAPGWPEWAVSAGIASRPYTAQVWRAISCHRSQLPLLDTLAGLPATTHAALWGITTLYRVYSLVDTGYQYEIDLFAGLRAWGSHDEAKPLYREQRLASAGWATEEC